MPSLFDQARDKNYWRLLNPKLSISNVASESSAPLIKFDENVLAIARQNLRTKGYLQVDDVLNKEQMDLLAAGAEVIQKSGWPTVFVMVYDQYWETFCSVRDLVASILGDDYQQLPNLWCHYAKDKNNKSGWGPRRDRPAVNTIMPDGMPTTLIVWIPMTDVSTNNRCIFVVPTDVDPHLPTEGNKVNLINPQDICVLPASKGSVIAWNEAIINWQGGGNDKNWSPHASMLATFQRGDKLPYELPLLDAARLPGFEERLGIIGLNCMRFAKDEGISDEMIHLCSRIGLNVPPLRCPEGLASQTLEIDQRLSDSFIWTLQEERQASLDANVVFKTSPLMSSAPFVSANVEMFLAFLADHAEHLDMSEPLLIAQLGGLSGAFAYRFIRETQRTIVDFITLKNLKWRYLLTDPNPNCISFWKQNHSLLRLRDEGLLEFAIFNAETDAEIKLSDSEEVIRQKDRANPMVLIANDVFRSMRHDVFRVVDGALQETRFTIYRDENKQPLSAPIEFDQLRISERYFDIDSHYYDDKKFNSSLEYYKDNLTEASVAFPIGALRAIANLLKISGNNLFLLASDKGFSSLNSARILGLWEQKLVVEKKVFLDVNFDAIQRYFAGLDGVSYHSGDTAESGTFVAALLAQGIYELPQFKHYFRQHIQRRDEINSFGNLVKKIKSLELSESAEANVRELLSIVRICNYDPAAFISAYDTYCSHLRDQLASIEEYTKDELAEALNRVSQLIFLEGEQAIQRLFVLFIDMQRYDDGLVLAKQLLERLGPEYSIYDHVGIIHEHNCNFVEAMESFQKSAELRPGHPWPAASLEQVRNKIANGASTSFSVARQKAQ